MRQKKPLSENFIKALHKILLDSDRGQNKAPGQFRKIQVFIGAYGASIDEATFVPPPPQEISRLFSNFEKYLHADDDVDPLVKFAIGHYQFEEIHPFLDGNGRIGRLLVPLFLYEKNITAHPNIYISEFLEKHRDIYYDLLNAVSRKNEWIPWIRFFLEAIQKQTEIFLERVIKIEKLYKDLKEKMPELNSIYANSFLDALFIKPRFTAKSTRELTGETNTQTLYNLIDKFIEFDIISDIIPQKERNKIYAFSDLIKIVS